MSHKAALPCSLGRTPLAICLAYCLAAGPVVWVDPGMAAEPPSAWIYPKSIDPTFGHWTFATPAFPCQECDSMILNIEHRRFRLESIPGGDGFCCLWNAIHQPILAWSQDATAWVLAYRRGSPVPDSSEVAIEIYPAQGYWTAGSVLVLLSPGTFDYPVGTRRVPLSDLSVRDSFLSKWLSCLSISQVSKLRWRVAEGDGEAGGARDILSRTYALTFPDTLAVPPIIQILERLPCVEYAEPNGIATVTPQPGRGPRSHRRQ